MQAAIKDDKELQAWAADLAEHGRVATMPAHIESRAQLIELLTNVLYIFTALHCAVNYSQDVIGGYVPNVPLMARASYRDLAARGESNPITEKELVRCAPCLRPCATACIARWVVGATGMGRLVTVRAWACRFMPARATARNQLQTLLILCAYRFDQLGHYDKAFQSVRSHAPGPRCYLPLTLTVHCAPTRCTPDASRRRAALQHVVERGVPLLWPRGPAGLRQPLRR